MNLGGGGKRTAEHALQNHFWRPQKSGLVWSAPLSFKGNDRESPKKRGGKRIVGGGSKKRFCRGVFRRIYGMFNNSAPKSHNRNSALTEPSSGKSKWGLNKWGLKVLVHNFEPIFGKGMRRSTFQ